MPRTQHGRVIGAPDGSARFSASFQTSGSPVTVTSVDSSSASTVSHASMSAPGSFDGVIVMLRNVVRGFFESRTIHRAYACASAFEWIGNDLLTDFNPHREAIDAASCALT